MKAAIIYYSYSGNTKKVAEILAKYLRQKSEVELTELKCLDESQKFLVQCSRAFRHQKGKIGQANTDLSAYSLICIGTPVWAFGPTPALNTYLDMCSGLENKAIVLFTTYGSGAGNARCLDYMQGILSKKDAKAFKRFSVQQGRVRDEEFVVSQIKGASI